MSRQGYSWIDENRERRFPTWDDEIAHMEEQGYSLVPPRYKVPHWSVFLTLTPPELFVSSPSGPRIMDAALDRYAAELGYPLYSVKGEISTDFS